LGRIADAANGPRQSGALRAHGPSKGRGTSMIRSELLQLLARDNPELRAEEIEQVVDIFFDEISARLAEGGRVELRGFGAFSTRQRESRQGRNPRSGQSVAVPAKRVPYFKPGKEMRERLNK
jgi:integration host factor subunit beta